MYIIIFCCLANAPPTEKLPRLNIWSLIAYLSKEFGSILERWLWLRSCLRLRPSEAGLGLGPVLIKVLVTEQHQVGMLVTSECCGSAAAGSVLKTELMTWWLSSSAQVSHQQEK